VLNINGILTRRWPNVHA